MRYNYFKLLDLMPDGPQANNTKIIQQAIENWERATRDKIEKAIDIVKRQNLVAQLKELPNMQRMLTDVSLRKQHAEELKARYLESLRYLISIMLAGSEVYGTKDMAKKEISSFGIKRIATQFNLLPSTVQKEFQANGYRIIKAKQIRVDFLLPDYIIHDLEDQLMRLKDYLNNNPESKCFSLIKADNLYEYLALMKDESIQNASVWEHTDTGVIHEEFEKLSKTHIGSDTLNLCARMVESIAAKKIFIDNETRIKYDNVLKLKKLQPLFDLLKKVPEEIKNEPYFAEECIRRIQELFTDREKAVALYNRNVDYSLDKPYES